MSDRESLEELLEASTRDRLLTGLTTEEEFKSWFDHFSDVVELKFDLGEFMVDIKALIDQVRKRKCRNH